MPDILKIYSVENNIKTATLVIDESTLGLDKFSYLKDVVSKELESGINSFSFDMKDLNTINSSGLGILISCLKKINESGGSLTIINPNEKIKSVFKLTKLDKVFEI
ncbi:MAG TPA: STAS domain-containing protein [Ignavibacteria bacterium]|nr:STAS domain-containing protein [Ignavibacteria bacterium]